MHEVPSDADLVRQALGGRPAAYGDLARRWSPRILAACHAQTRCADAAEDLAQEALMRGMSALATLQEPGKFGAWLRGIARCVCLDWLKDRRRTEVPLSVVTGGDGEGPLPLDEGSEVVEDDEPDLARLMGEVERLPEAYRETLMLYYYGDMTYEELGDLLGLSAATVNMRLTKARSLLRAKLTKAGNRDEME